MFGKRSVIFLLVLSIVSSTFYLPVFTPRTQAQLPAVTWDVPTIVMKIVNGAAMVIAQTMIDRMTQSTIKWAQSGFEGNPAYVTNPQQYFRDLADGVAGNFIAGSDLNFLCSPFQTQIRLALLKHYTPPDPFQCTLTQVVGDIDAFYNDFSQGGWDGWFAMTQNDSNNPYGSYLDAQVELDSRIAEKLGLQKEQLNWNQGFLSWSDCEWVNPPMWVDDPGRDGTLPSRKTNPAYQPGYAEGECIKRGPIQTPGSVIQSQLNEVLPSGLKKLQVAQHIDQLISSFATGLLTRYVFGPKGLFANNSRSNTPQSISSRTGNLDIDVPADGIPDGMDFDYDGRLASSVDICHHGGTASSTAGCVKSFGLKTSPYFTPICQATDRAVIVLKDFTTFIDTYADQMEGGAVFKGRIIPPILAAPPGTPLPGSGVRRVDNFRNKADAQIWWDRHNQVDSAVSEIVSAIRERSASYFDNLEIATNRYYHFITKVSESLIKDADLDLSGWMHNGGGGLENLMRHSAYNLRYFMEVKTQIGKCESPNIEPVDRIPLPPEVEPPGGGGGTCTPPADANRHPDESGTVAQAKADLGAQGVDLTGPCGAFAIVNEAAKRIGAGLWDKPGGNNCQGFATDIIAYPDGYIYDVLIDGGGANTPTWDAATCLPLEPSRYRAPI